MYSDTPREAATALLAPVNASETFKTPTKTTVIISSPTEPKSASDDTKPASLQSPLYAPTSSQVSTGTSSGPKATDLNTGSLQGSMYSPPADTFTAKPSAASKPLGQSRFAPENYKPGH